MRFQQYSKQIFAKIKGQLPTFSFIWYLLFTSVAISTAIGIMYVYYIMFNVIDGHGPGQVTDAEYKEIIDVQILNEVVGFYEL